MLRRRIIIIIIVIITQHGVARYANAHVHTDCLGEGPVVLYRYGTSSGAGSSRKTRGKVWNNARKSKQKKKKCNYIVRCMLFKSEFTLRVQGLKCTGVSWIIKINVRKMWYTSVGTYSIYLKSNADIKRTRLFLHLQNPNHAGAA